MTTKHVRQSADFGNKSIGKDGFDFSCHPGVSCFKDCCRKLDLYLYPYDIVRLKNGLSLSSSDFLYKYTRVSEGSHPYFPSLMLLMNDDSEHLCPFLGEEGCLVYKDRPSSCRTYPVERAVERVPGSRSLTTHYFITNHAYCKGHAEDKHYTIRKWESEQQLFDFNLMNDLWAQVDAFFATNPWQGEGTAGPLQQLAFMVCYNIDEFRGYYNDHKLWKHSGLDKSSRRLIERYDAELLKYGFQWLLTMLGGQDSNRLV
ncbi:MAG: YkgJ family cysteine cluster protein [Desulfobulbaceae bacterium]|nr:YkgJ family cysteine cluster protein [Desulfobulbaceae bacterium]